MLAAFKMFVCIGYKCWLHSCFILFPSDTPPQPLWDWLKNPFVVRWIEAQMPCPPNERGCTSGGKLTPHYQPTHSFIIRSLIMAMLTNATKLQVCSFCADVNAKEVVSSVAIESAENRWLLPHCGSDTEHTVDADGSFQYNMHNLPRTVEHTVTNYQMICSCG